MSIYQPELGQMMFGNPTGQYEVPNYADALIRDLIHNDIDTVFWNINQRKWDEYDDPAIPGVVFRQYWWGDENAPEAALPNFAFRGVEIRWYKHPGRGMSCNQNLTPAQWAEWYEECHKAIWTASPKIGVDK